MSFSSTQLKIMVSDFHALYILSSLFSLCYSWLYFTSLAKHKSYLIKLFSYTKLPLCNIGWGKKHNYANLSHIKFTSLNHRWILHFSQRSYSVSLIISYFKMTIYFIFSLSSQYLFNLTLLLTSVKNYSNHH